MLDLDHSCRVAANVCSNSSRLRLVTGLNIDTYHLLSGTLEERQRLALIFRPNV